MDSLKIPKHIAIIMDGNGRWARRNGMPRVMGHYKGAEVAEEITEACRDLGVEYLTLFAFSTENWNRPSEEVYAIFELIESYIRSKKHVLIANKIRLRFIGRRDRIKESLRLLMEELEQDTSKDFQITVTVAVDYGGRDDIIRAVNKVISSGTKDVNEETFANMLDMSGTPDPDLMIRTAGEKRISNFLLWNLAYTELYFTEVCWPEFTKEELLRAVEDFSRRKRKFGKVLE